jgi:oligoribonuclease NrnB/cAMP/cGMP phosphodiesterase (DHH superfamily)
MAEEKRRLIHVVSHGPACLDGAAAAAAVARFYRRENVQTVFAANAESDRIIQAIPSRAGADQEHQLWITDLSWTSTKTAESLKRLVAEGTRVFWIDHHRTALSRAGGPEFNVPFAGKVLTEQYSAAKLVFDFLNERAATLEGGDVEELERFSPVIAIADDHDRWVHQIKDSSDWALAVQTLGARDSYREMVKLRLPKMSPILAQGLEIGRRAVRQSIELARATQADTVAQSGVRIRTACCFGYNSEVAADLYNQQTNVVIALYDLRSFGVSLRKSADCAVDLSKLAEKFGGGGHDAAAGFEFPEIRSVLGRALAADLGERLAKAT